MITLCEPDPAVAAWLAVRLGPTRLVTHVSAIGDASLVVLGPGVEFEKALLFAENFPMPIVLLRDVVSADLIQRAEAVGILGVAATGEADRLSGHRAGRIVTVFAAKDGCGKTTLATNLAVALNDGGRRRVCLLDLDLSFGDLASALRLEPDRTLADAIASGATTPYRSGLDCVLATVGPGEAEQIADTAVGTLLARLRSQYEYLVVDTEARFTPHAVAALDAADHHVLVTTPDRPALKNLRTTLDILDVLVRPHRPRSIVCNRVAPDTGPSPPDLETVLKAPIACLVPAHRAVLASVNAGVPLYLADPGHEASRAIRTFAETRLVASSRCPHHPE